MMFRVLIGGDIVFFRSSNRQLAVSEKLRFDNTEKLFGRRQRARIKIELPSEPEKFEIID